MHSLKAHAIFAPSPAGKAPAAEVIKRKRESQFCEIFGSIVIVRRRQSQQQQQQQQEQEQEACSSEAAAAAAMEEEYWTLIK